MSRQIEVARPGVVYRLHKARTPKYCSLCGRSINPGDQYWQRKCLWRWYSQPVCEKCG